MNFEVKLSTAFLKDVKPISKKYRSFSADFEALIDYLESNPTLGTPLGRNCYKIRLAIKSKGKGKSGGARIITYVITEKQEVVLLTIYDKQNKSDLKANELDKLLENL
ncbi:type II toxin-antitoxin system RelE/ParE family toxin [Dyadobacter sp. CY345]|uniref:type II toxin-antitoxin system RelE/ParE family toxin n=1 Tax=Dyadobacter sp. CY345 TaxID=2909335 RepID=UPI001F1716E4|nr:type II toxin-antitoxin system RelE/ParE family toxin [Dyadobacter sp. CY345]MCF2446356.1 type II toxin-antitoxin system RelE/ParE family toxin [Dyadobacter sp. CY345]